MFIKVVDNSSWDFPEPKSELIKIASNGLIGEDRRAFVKRAGASLLDKVDESRVFSKFYKKKLIKLYTFI